MLNTVLKVAAMGMAICFLFLYYRDIETRRYDWHIETVRDGHWFIVFDKASGVVIRIVPADVGGNGTNTTVWRNNVEKPWKDTFQQYALESSPPKQR